MGYASRAGRARTSSTWPEAHAICDYCGFRYNHVDLRFQMQWAGTQLINTGSLVCNRCYDKPQEQLRAIAVPADPVPIDNPRIEAFFKDETNIRTTSGQNTINPQTGIPVPRGDVRVTQSNRTRVTQQTGEPPGGLNQKPGTDPTIPDAAGGNDPGLPPGNTEVPETGPLT